MLIRSIVIAVICLCIQAISAFADPLSDIGLFVVDRDVPGIAWRVGVHGIKPTVTNVVTDSLAQKLGIQKGDIILSVADKAVRNTSELRSMEQELASVTVLRGTERITLSNTIRASEQAQKYDAADQSPSPPLQNSLSTHESEKPAIFPQLGHTGRIGAVAFSPDGRYALSGSSDNTLKFWDVATGREIRTFYGHNFWVTSVAFSPDGRYALSGAIDTDKSGALKLWNVATGREIRAFSGDFSVAFSPDGRYALGSSYKKLKLWDVATGREIQTFSGHTSSFSSVAFSPDGKYALSGSSDNMLKLWDISSGREIKTFSGHTSSVSSVAFSHDGRHALSGSWDQTLKLWNISSGREIKTFSGHTSRVKSVAFSPDGKYALSGSSDNTLKLWSISSGKEIKTFSGHTSSVSSVAFSHDGRHALSGSWDQTLKLWDISSGREIKTFSGHTSSVSSVAFSHDGRYVLSGRSDMTLKYLDTATGRGIRSFSGRINFVHPNTFSPDGRYALSGSFDKTLELWDVVTGKNIRTFSGHTDLVTPVTFSSDGRYALSVSFDKTLKLWNITTGKNIRTFSGHTDAVFSAIFSPDGRYVLSGSSDKTLKLWDIATGREIRTFSGHTSFVTSVVFSPDGRYALSGSSDKTLKLWDVATGKNIRTFSGHTNAVISVTFSPDGCYALSSSDKTLKLWDVATGKNIRTFARQANSISSIAFSPDGRYVLSGENDGTIHYWNVTSGNEIITFIAFTDGEWITITPEGYFNASANGAQHLNVRVGNNVYGIDQLYSTLYRPDLVQAKLEGKDISQYAANVNINTVLTQKTLPPKVRFITRPATSDNPDITLKAEVCDNGGGVGDITLYLDNMPVVVDSIGRGLKAVAKSAEGCQQFEKTITLQNGSNSISLMAYNKNNTIESTRDSISITHREAITRKPTLHLLAIAVNSYRDGDLRLKYAIPDAKALAASVQKTTGGLFEKVQLHTIYDAEATKAGIAETFARIGVTTRREDVFLLYVAGHGITNRIDGAYYFLPYDFRYTGEDALTRQGVSENDFKKYLAQIQATKSLLLLDTCNSGSFAEAVASRGMIEKTAVNKLVRAVGRATIVASSKDQVALEGYEGHGVFTWTLLEGMNGKAASSDGRITVNNLATFVEETLPKITYKKWGYEQIPQKSLMGMDFPIGMR